MTPKRRVINLSWFFFITFRTVITFRTSTEVRGAFKQVLRAHIFHVTLFSIAVRPIQTEFIFSSLMLWTVNVITHPPIARSRRSR